MKPAPGVPVRAGERGLTMVEVLVAIVILATALLGIAGLQTISLQLNQAAVVRSQAVLLANDIIDRMRANRGAAADYEIALDEVEPAGTTVVAADLGEWRSLLANRLPSGSGSVAFDADGNVAVVIQWLDMDDAQANLAVRDTSTSFEFRTRL